MQLKRAFLPILVAVLLSFPMSVYADTTPPTTSQATTSTPNTTNGATSSPSGGTNTSSASTATSSTTTNTQSAATSPSTNQSQSSSTPTTSSSTGGNSSATSSTASPSNSTATPTPSTTLSSSPMFPSTSPEQATELIQFKPVSMQEFETFVLSKAVSIVAFFRTIAAPYMYIMLIFGALVLILPGKGTMKSRLGWGMIWSVFLAYLLIWWGPFLFGFIQGNATPPG